jgi:hypothetical protein
MVVVFVFLLMPVPMRKSLAGVDIPSPPTTLTAPSE